MKTPALWISSEAVKLYQKKEPARRLSAPPEGDEEINSHRSKKLGLNQELSSAMTITQDAMKSENVIANFRKTMFALMLVCSPANAQESICYGTTNNGRLENGVQLPLSGKNFSSYSPLAAGLGRTYVHNIVRDIVAAAYKTLEKSDSSKSYVYGETGFAAGGSFRPHKTHQNGLSVDFMVPILNENGESVPLPTTIFNKLGYSIEFDSSGQYKEYRIDFEGLAAHLYQLHRAALLYKSGIQRVIFDPKLQPRLFRTEHGGYLKKHLKFNEKRAWVRHDEHYHVDFSVQCREMEDK